jgi:hypothetical protein
MDHDDQTPATDDTQLVCAAPPEGPLVCAAPETQAPAPETQAPAPAQDNPVLAPVDGGGSDGPSTWDTVNSVAGQVGTWTGYAQGDIEADKGSIIQQVLPKQSEAIDSGVAVAGGVGGVVNGVYDINAGFDQLDQGNTATGVYDLTKGAAETGCGAATVLSAPAVGGAVGKALGGGADLAEKASSASGIVGGALGVVQGGEDINTGLDDYEKGRTANAQSKGIGEVAQGGLEVGSGIATTLVEVAPGEALGLGASVDGAAALTGAGAASVGGAVLGAGAAGVAAGIGMNEATEKSGLFHESGVVGPDGKPINQSGSDVAAEFGNNVAQWIDPSRVEENGAFHSGGQSTMAQLAGGAATLAATPVALAADVAGTATAGWNWLKSEL